ncbi:hypothetical protein ACHAW6_000031 [Cyclotella cf. meneghiniana]
MEMLWEVQHRWPAGLRFAHNLYRHECCLILRGPCGTTPAILLSQEGVMQGCMWDMIIYGIGLMPLAETLRRSDPTGLQPWYADNLPSKAQPPTSRNYSTCSAAMAQVWDTSRSRRNAGSSVLHPPNRMPCQVFTDASLPVSYCQGK